MTEAPRPYSMQSDSKWVDPDLDDGSIRTFYVCKACPLEHECSENAWKRLNARSVDIDRLCAMVKRHLMVSSLHKCPEEQADALARSLCLDSWEETIEDRDAYRADVAKKWGDEE